MELNYTVHSAWPVQNALAQRRDEQPEMLDDIALMLGRQFAVYASVYQAAQAERLDMPLTDLQALDLVMEFDALATGQLAQMLGVSSGGATALINRLEAAGYIHRDRHPLDRRMVVIKPVKAACQRLMEQRHAIAAEVALLARRYDHEQLEIVHKFLSQCMRAFRHDTQLWLETRRWKNI